MKFNNIKTLIFDYDGTIHNSLKIYKPAFLKAYEFLVHEGYKPTKSFKDSEIASFLGQSPKEMWDTFGKGLDQSVKNHASQIISNVMAEMIDNGEAQLYNHAMDTLKTLKSRGYTLVFLSNCRIDYMEKHKQLFDLGDVFRDMVCAEAYDYIEKYEIFNQIKTRYDPKMVMIGDRKHDIKTGINNHLFTIGCTYGFGTKDELSQADYLIDDITELLDMFK